MPELSKCQQAFEEYVLNSAPDSSFLKKTPTGEYVKTVVTVQWYGWRACWYILNIARSKGERNE